MIGDHIRTLRTGRWTHAIDCGDETVILLSDDGDARRVRRGYRPEFVSGAEAVEVVRHRERTFPADEVVARAYSRIADPALAAMFRDSEAFADWCTTGRVPSGPPRVAVAPAAPVEAPPAPARGRKTATVKAAARSRPRVAPKAAPKRKARASRRAAPARKPARKPARTPGRKAGGGAKRAPTPARGARRKRR